MVRTVEEILENDFTERERYNGELLHLKELNEMTVFLVSEEKYKKDIEKYQSEIVKEIFSKEMEKVSENEYKFSDNIDFSTKNKWTKTVVENCDLGSGFFEVLEKNITGSELYRRYDTEDDLEPFKVYHNDELLYQNKTLNNDYDKIREYVVNLKGEEFWDNMDLDNIEEWGDLSKDLVILYGENNYIYTDFYNYSDGYETVIGQECLGELECFREKVRLDFKENSNEDKIISKENILKLAKEYDCFDEIKIMLSNKEEIEKDNFEKTEDKELDV